VCPAGQGLLITFHITPPAGGGAPFDLTDTADALGHAEVTYTPTVTGTYGVETTVAEDACEPSDTTFAVASIPVTGSDSQQMLVTASALVFVGLAFSFVAVRRRRSRATA
jgi:LPXTG-motif cell wall-anchored protein